MNRIQLKVKHFHNAIFANGNGPIRNAAEEMFPGKYNFQGVGMSRINGAAYYHENYGRKEFYQDLGQCADFIYEEEKVIRTLMLSDK